MANCQRANDRVEIAAREVFMDQTLSLRFRGTPEIDGS